MNQREKDARARLAQVEADPSHPHRDAVIRSLRRIVGDETHTPDQVARMVVAVEG